MGNKINYSKYGYYRVAAYSPKLFLANPLKNAKKIISLAKKAEDKQAIVSLFPELSLTGYTCEDLFLGTSLLGKTDIAIDLILRESKDFRSVIVFGSPVRSSTGNLLNCAIAVYKGKIVAIVPKTYIPNYGEFYEKRWFSSGKDVYEEVEICGQKALINKNTLIKVNDLTIGIEICEDLWSPIPPSSYLALKGANLILNLSASNDLVAKADYRKELVSQQSARLSCAYIYSSSGAYESTKDVVFGGHLIAAENGTVLKESERFSFSSTSIVVDVDVNKIDFERRRNGTFFDTSQGLNLSNFITHSIKAEYTLPNLSRKYPKTPFIPSNVGELQKRVSEILEIQSTGLARRLESVPSKNIVLGLSGGLDSCLALIVATKALEKLKTSNDFITCITMPGLGTSSETKQIAFELAKAFGVKIIEIDIKKSVAQHFEDIGHDSNDHSVVFENAQARERTQILFDYSNKTGGIVLGTGDLSELALGWCTFNGDHISGYNVNASVPKTLVKFIINQFALSQEDNKRLVLEKVLGLPISPELLPLKDGKIQSTEEKIGPYFLHDFFMYHFIRSGFSKVKIMRLAVNTFRDEYSIETIKKWHKEFFKRFFASQFKRTTLPPGPKIGSVSLSPRGDWRCPDEI